MTEPIAATPKPALGRPQTTRASPAHASAESIRAESVPQTSRASPAYASTESVRAESVRAVAASVAMGAAKAPTEPLMAPRGSPSWRCHSPMAYWSEPMTQGAPPPSSRNCRSPARTARASPLGVRDGALPASMSVAVLQQQQPQPHYSHSCSAFSVGLGASPSEKSCVPGLGGASVTAPAGGSALVQASSVSTCTPAGTSACTSATEGTSLNVAAASPGTPLWLVMGSSAVTSAADARPPVTGRPHFAGSPRVEPQTRSPSPKRCGVQCLRMCTSPSARGSPRVQPLVGRLAR